MLKNIQFDVGSNEDPLDEEINLSTDTSASNSPIKCQSSQTQALNLLNAIFDLLSIDRITHMYVSIIEDFKMNNGFNDCNGFSRYTNKLGEKIDKTCFTLHHLCESVLRPTSTTTADTMELISTNVQFKDIKSFT